MTRYRPSRRLSLLPILAALCVAGGFVPRPAQAGDRVWTPIGPFGGDLKAIAFHPLQPGVLWVGTERDGVFRSTDGGVTWAPMGQKLPGSSSAGFLGVSAAEPSTLYALSGWDVLRSVDGGPWEVRGQHPNTAFAVDPARADVLWAGTYANGAGGIDRSDDGGLTWTPVHALAGGSRGAFPTGFVFAPADPSTLYAGLISSDGAPRGVLRSRDGGASWELIGEDLVPEGEVSVDLAIAPDTGVLFATAVRNGSAGEPLFAVYRSTDGGDTWALVLPGGFTVTAGPGGLVISQSGQRSLDGGLTWSLTSPPVSTMQILAAHPLSPGTVFASPQHAGLFRSTDFAASWQEANEGILAAWALDLVADPIVPGTLYASTVGGGLFKTTEGGGVWEHPLPQAGDFGSPYLLNHLIAASAGGETTLYALQYNEVLFRSEDGGASWTNLGNPGLYNLRALAVDPRDPRSVYLGGEFSSHPQCPSRKSSDGGETWTCLRPGKGFDLAVHPTRPANLWAVGRTVYRSTDRGRTWKAAGRGLTKDAVTALALAPSTQEVAYAITYDGVFRTADGGRSWRLANEGLPRSGTVTALAVHPRNPSLVYAGVQAGFGAQEAGVYRSTDGGRRWKRLQALPASFAGSLVIDPHDPRTIYAGTFRGFYAITLR